MPHPLLKGFADSVRPVDRRAPWAWCEDHVHVDKTSAIPGRWRSENSTWSRPIMEAAADPEVRVIVGQCCAQGAKTQTMMNLLCWLVGEDPGPALWVMAAKDEAKDFLTDRILPTLRECAPAWSQLVGQAEMVFRFRGMPLYFTGAGSESKVQGKPIRWLFLDEVRNYGKGIMEQALKRVRTYWNSKTLIFSTPGKEDDAMDQAFKSGTQSRWHLRCPGCGKVHALEWENLKWDTNETTKPGGRWVMDEVAKTIRLECPGCGAKWRDTPGVRRWITREGFFLAMNPNAPRSRVSFTWSALLPQWVPWVSIVEEFILAGAALKIGDRSKMVMFVTETLGRPWKDELGEIDNFDFLLSRRGRYEFGDPWPEGEVLFMAADRQASGGEHYWYVVRSFGRFGKSRLVSYGRSNSLAALEEVRKGLGVTARNSVIDAAFKQSETLRFCQATGWKPFRGSDAEAFPVLDLETKKLVRRLWDTTLVDPAFGKRRAGRSRPVRLYRWSNPGIKDLTFEYATGLVGDWSLPAKIGRDYLEQVSAESRIEYRDPRGYLVTRWQQTRRDNHLGDCEHMITAAALMAGVISTGSNVPASGRK